MYVCVYLSVYLCDCVCACTHMNLCVCVCLRVHVCLCVHRCMCVHACVFVSLACEWAHSKDILSLLLISFYSDEIVWLYGVYSHVNYGTRIDHSLNDRIHKKKVIYFTLASKVAFYFKGIAKHEYYVS